MNQPVSHTPGKDPHDHASHDHAKHAHSCCAHDAAPSLVQLSEAASGDARLSRFRIEAMDCPTEQTLIQNKLGTLAGVEPVSYTHLTLPTN